MVSIEDASEDLLDDILLDPSDIEELRNVVISTIFMEFKEEKILRLDFWFILQDKFVNCELFMILLQISMQKMSILRM